MTNKLTRSEFMKSGIVATLGLLVPKFIANIGGYVTGLGRGSPYLLDNLGLAIDLEPKTWEVRTQEEFIYAINSAGKGDTILLHPGNYQGGNSPPWITTYARFQLRQDVTLTGVHVV